MVTAIAIAVDVLYYTGHGVDYTSRWLARGFITAVVVYAFAEISGAHADPVVTLAFALRRLVSWSQMCAYVCAQFAGSFAAALLLWTLFGGSIGLGASHPGTGIAPPVAALCELVLTFVFVLTILMTAQEEASIGKEAALAVGFVVAACGFAAGPISGASMNPARTIAPQVLAGAFNNVWIYVVGPIAGSALAVAVHAALSGKPTSGARKAARGR